MAKENNYLASLKALETENFLDRIFYRPLGYRIAKAIQHTGITPNAVTILSIFVGAAAGVFWFFPYNIAYAIAGILFLVSANILDCVDGQLARLTGIKSQVGRILDGLAGDIWFLLIYIAFAYRLNLQFITPWNPWIYLLIVIASAYSHLTQAALTDYYKTLHLFFISKEKGKEFENSKKIEERYKQMTLGVNKVITWGYSIYTKMQEWQTPQLQAMLKRLSEKYGNDIPDEIRANLRTKSKQIMPILDLNTFNGRSAVLLIAVLFNILWIYFIWEIVVLNIIKIIVRRRHEYICSQVEQKN